MNTITRNVTGMLTAAAFTWVLCSSTALAQNQPASKVTAKTADFTLLPEIANTSSQPIQGQWMTLLSNRIKTSNQKDLFIGASFEVGLYTKTLVRSKLMVSDTSKAVAKVEVRVLVDGVPAQPGAVTFGRRSQTLSATLEGAISGCLSLSTNLDGSVSIVLNEACVRAEEIELILDTMDAASFNFVAVDVPQGIHTISVQAQIGVEGAVQNGEYRAAALVGKGSMTVESIRLIKAEDVIAVPEL